jgi:hypothetical protein
VGPILPGYAPLSPDPSPGAGLLFAIEGVSCDTDGDAEETVARDRLATFSDTAGKMLRVEMREVRPEGAILRYALMKEFGSKKPTETILVKRYARSRLYDTAALRYVTVDDLRGWRARGTRFIVLDAETGDDITRIVLA